MKFSRTMLSASIIAAFALVGAAQADDASPAAAPAAAPAQDGTRSDGQEMDTIVVHGIRESLKRSLETKRDADAVVDAITAEDIGKFPSTNVAEAMSQIPGVTIDRRFGQGERVSINGTDPSLNLTFLDGHPVAQTTWLYGEQPNHGFDYTMLAPEILGKLEVYKSPEARLPEGSVGGTIIMHTREPLDLAANTLSGSVGATYGDQSDSTKPNASLLYSWKNTDNTFGIAVSAQHYEEKVDRQGEEIFGYSPVSSLSASPAVAAGLAAGTLNPNDLVPQEINAAYFQQTRKRDSATLNMQWKPNDQFELDVKGLYVREKFDNFNQSMYGFTTQTPQNITSLTPGGGGLITSGHSCGNDDPSCPGLQSNGGNGPVNTYLDNQARKSTVTTKGLDLTGTYKGEGWSLAGNIGISKADDDSNSQAFIEPYYNGGYTWDIRRGISFDSPSAAADPANWHDGDTPGGGWGGNYAQWPAKAKDNYGQIDFSKNFDGFFNELLLGVRYAKHDESRELFIYGGVRTANLATIGFDGLTDILSGFDGFSSDQRHHVQTSFDNVMNWVLGSPLGTSPDPGSFLNNTYSVTQESDAGYAQLNFGNDAIHGNFGVRFVHTDIDSAGYSYSGTPTYPAPAGSYQTASSSHNNVLPSINVAWDAAPDVVIRGALAGHRLGAVQPGSAQHLPQRHGADGVGRQCRPRSVQVVEPRLLGRVVLRRAVRAGGVDLLQGRAQLHHDRLAHRAPVQLAVPQRSGGLPAHLRRRPPRQLRHQRLLRLQRSASAQRRHGEGEGLHAELPAAVRRHRLRHVRQLHLFGCVDAYRPGPAVQLEERLQHQPVLREGSVQCAHHLRLAQPLPRRRLRSRCAARVGRRLRRTGCVGHVALQRPSVAEPQRDEPARRNLLRVPRQQEPARRQVQERAPLHGQSAFRVLTSPSAGDGLAGPE